MMVRFLVLFLLVLISTQLRAEKSGEVLFDQLCAQCHAVSTGMRAAPPVFAVKTHLKRAYSEKEAFIQRVVEWVREPSAEKALMPDAVRRFGVMPKLGYSEDEVRQVAEWLYG